MVQLFGLLSFQLTLLLLLCFNVCLSFVNHKNSRKFYLYQEKFLFNISLIEECYFAAHGEHSWDSERYNGPSQHSGDYFLYNGLVNSKLRTFSPSEADLLIVPTYLPALVDISCQKLETDEFYKAMSDYLTINKYIFDMDGFSHVGIFSRFDWWVSTYDLKRHMKNAWIATEDRWPVMFKQANVNCPDSVVPLPYVTNTHISFSHQTQNPRPISFFFQGASRPGCGKIRDLTKQSFIQDNSSFIQVNDRWKFEGHEQAELFSQYMMNSTYCIHLCGDTQSSRRLYDSIAAHCIPVLIDNPNLWDILPFQWRIDYRAFSVVLNESDYLNDPIGTAKRGVALFEAKKRNKRMLHKQLSAASRNLVYLDPKQVVADNFLIDLLVRQSRSRFRLALDEVLNLPRNICASRSGQLPYNLLGWYDKTEMAVPHSLIRYQFSDYLNIIRQIKINFQITKDQINNLPPDYLYIAMPNTLLCDPVNLVPDKSGFVPFRSALVEYLSLNQWKYEAGEEFFQKWFVSETVHRFVHVTNPLAFLFSKNSLSRDGDWFNRVQFGSHCGIGYPYGVQFTVVKHAMEGKFVIGNREVELARSLESDILRFDFVQETLDMLEDGFE